MSAWSAAKGCLLLIFSFMRFNSVATTSSKSVPVLQADIRRVLDRIGIQYRMNKGGFECVHVPSIDLSSVLSPQEVNHGATNQQPSQHSVSTSGPDAHHGDPWSLEGLDSSSGSFAQHAAEKRHGAAGESEEAAFFCGHGDMNMLTFPLAAIGIIRWSCHERFRSFAAFSIPYRRR